MQYQGLTAFGKGLAVPEFSDKSREILSTCDSRLIAVFNRVVKVFDCTVVSGHRNKVEQELLFSRGLSKLHFPDSLHNLRPSLAVDVYPYPINWQDRERFHYFGGFVMGMAEMMDISLRWGGDWNKDWQVRDNSFDDLGHFELES